MPLNCNLPRRKVNNALGSRTGHFPNFDAIALSNPAKILTSALKIRYNSPGAEDVCNASGTLIIQ
jgi:hypothetical protein